MAAQLILSSQLDAAMCAGLQIHIPFPFHPTIIRPSPPQDESEAQFNQRIRASVHKALQPTAKKADYLQLNSEPKDPSCAHLDPLYALVCKLGNGASMRGGGKGGRSGVVGQQPLHGVDRCSN